MWALEGGMPTGVFAHVGMVVELVDKQRPLLPQGVQLSLRVCITALHRPARALQTICVSRCFFQACTSICL